jgi:ribosomal-protein-alanine N-acetyltransferase
LTNLHLQTERLILRPLVHTDVDICAALYTSPDVMRFIRAPKTSEKVVEEMPNICRRAGHGLLGVWCVLDRNNGEKIGTAILLPLPINETDIEWSKLQENQFPTCEIQIGYMFKKEHWGQGYATEACMRLLRFAFENTPLLEVVAVIDKDNIASRTVLTNAGLAYENGRRAYAVEDVPSFKIKKSDWLSRTEFVDRIQ